MMKYRVAYSKVAIRDLDRVWAEVFDASKSKETTRKYLDELLDKIEAKAEFPASGSPLYYENSFTGYYFIVFKAYLIFYRIKGDILFVDRILYGKSDYLRHLHLNELPIDPAFPS